MKGGASPSDIRDIQKYSRAGHTADQISQAMNIDLACVKSFLPDNVERVKEEIRVAEKKDAEMHKKKKEVMRKAKAEVRTPVQE